jgi:hypothetical protein
MTLQLHDTSNRATGSSFTNLSFFERAFALDFRLLLRLTTSNGDVNLPLICQSLVSFAL